MTQKNNSKIISVVHPISCGLDVHKDMVSACIIFNHMKDTGEIICQQGLQFADTGSGFRYRPPVK